MDIVEQRLWQHRIAGGKIDHPADVVRWMGAMQAQDYAQSVWAVGLRTTSPSLSAVERAIAERNIVITWPMRGTIHLVPPQDAQWMLQLMATRILASGAARRNQLGVDDATLETARQAFRLALHGGNRLLRSELMAVLERAGIDPAGQRGYHLLRHVAQEGLLCIGPREGKQQTFVLLDEWVPEQRELSRDEALAELAQRYFVSHGPATAHDFARWTGLTLTDARRGIAAVGSTLTIADVDGIQHCCAAEPIASNAASPEVHLLPGFDEYLLGYRDRDAILDSEHADRIVPGGNGVFRPMVVHGGRIVGTWRRTVAKSSVNIDVEFFDRPCPEQPLAEAAARYCDFLGQPLGAVVVSPIR